MISYRQLLFLTLSCLRTLRAVFGATLRTALNAGRIESTAYDVVAHTGKVLHTTAAHHDDGVLLKVVAFTGDVGVDFLTVGEAYTSHLTHSRVRLFRGRGVHTHAHTATLRT